MTWLNLRTLIEVPIFCASFSLFVQNSVVTNLIIYRTCYVDLGYNKSECALLGTSHKDNFTNELEKMVEPEANTIGLYLQLPPGLICAFTALFVGSWSDKHGRKWCLITAMGGQVLCFALVIVFSLLPHLSAWYLLLSSIPVIVTGGYAAILTLVLSYITDISDESNRGMRLGLFEVIFSLGTLIGTYSSSYIFKIVGYVGIYLIATGVMIVGFFFVFIMDESLPERQREALSQQQQSSFVEELKTMVKSVARKRSNYERSIILLCIAITSLFIFAFIADNSIIYLFLRSKFGWSLQKYNIFYSLRESLSIVGLFLGVYGLHKKLGVSESILILMGSLSSFSSSLVQGLASIDAHIYFAAVLKCLCNCVNPMVRSLISKIAKPDEIGKIFSVAVMVQNILQLLGSPAYTKIYNDTLITWPSLYNFITAGVYLLTIIFTIIIMILIRRTTSPVKFDILNEDVAAPSGSINDDGCE
ncbi:hypothetical protein HHI36_002937 [Cryptolaemus montrouzieri]|uniref:Proton-coupled folate transporter n=1 Tax=Cryptolaemus montrouzieri TaxID=559131 RepID=A0ABD2PCA6_9CUCU